MTLSTKLIVTFLACGIVPLSIVAVTSYSTANTSMETITQEGEASLERNAFNQLVALREVKKEQIEQYFSEREGDMGVLVETVKTLRSEAFQKLRAVRQIKRSAVERYFQSINDQILTFSEDKMVVQAMRDFRSAFESFRSENEVDGDELEHMRRELRTYYTGEFTEEYKSQNDGQSPNAENYFAQLDDDSIALQYQYIRANPNPLGSKHLLDASEDGSTYSKLHAEVHPVIRDYLDKFGFYDIFLISPDTGDIVYSVFKELDYSTSLVNGPYAQTNFGEAFRKANAAGNKDAVALVDYAQYAPSYQAPAGFIASPIFDGDEKIGVAIFQMPIDRLNTIMAERAGLGKTGETYLVGPDQLMRSDSYLDSESHSVVASFRNPAKGAVNTTASKLALAGKTDAGVIIDYNGNPVLSAYCPVEIGGITWGLLAEIDVAEAFAPKAENSEKDFFTMYNNLYGYYDLFLINPNGYCFYSVCHEPDYQTNLANGKYKNSNLGELVRQVSNSGKFGFADFAPYAPSNGTPAAFIAQPVTHQGKTELIVALQLPLDAINKIMGVRAGMGETGETYLVGSDKLMRSDSFLDPTNHTVEASFKNPDKGLVNTDAATAALNGETDAKVIIDYNGNPVLSAFTPVNVFGTSWALLAEIDESEAMAAVVGMKKTSASTKKKLMTWVGALAAIATVLVAFLAVLIARSISKPINRIIVGLREGADQVNDAAQQVSVASQQSAEGASEQASSLEETSSSLEEMAATTRQNADNARDANSLSVKARDAAQQGDQTVHQLNSAMTAISESSNQISKIIKVIEEIAFQTNLLALNAAVEAARAGEHGKGFAVVADEVRNLAQRAAQAAQETTGLIENSVNKSKEGADVATEVGKSLAIIGGDIAQVTDLIAGIAKASEEQAEGVDQINAAVSQMDRVVQQNAAGAEESASASEELSAQATTVKSMVVELNEIIQGTKQKGRSATYASPGMPSTTEASLAQSSSKRLEHADRFLPIEDHEFKDF